jgi:hydroxyacylglutathione hydrolase
VSVTPLPGGPWKQNCYIVAEGSDAVLVDPGGNATSILAYVGENGLRLHGVLNTHGHFDHLGAVCEVLRETGVPFFISGKEAPIMRSSNMLRFIFRSSEPVEVPDSWVDLDGLGGKTGMVPLGIECLATPGHTPGSYCFRYGDHLFGGDTVLPRAPGNTRLPGGDALAMHVSLSALRELPPATVLHPGHGQDQLLHDALDLIAARSSGSEAT